MHDGHLGVATVGKNKRDPRSQAEHDKIIEEIVRTKVEPYKYLVQTNLGRSGEYQVVDIKIGQQMFPDVIIRDRHSGQIDTLYEVETEESVNENHALEEWILYGSLQSKFILVVPIDRVAEACRLIEKYNIDIDRLEAYEVNSHGTIHVDVLNPREEDV